jgi:hypothetical protein
MDLQVIATAIATRYASVAATNGTETQTLSATSALPNQISVSALLVYPPEGDLSIDMGPHLDDTYRFPVRVLLDPLAMEDRSRWLYAWANAMRTKVQGDFDLGLVGTVDWAMVSSMRAAIDGIRYASPLGTPGGDLFDVVEHIVTVKVWELTTIG